jgi:hypothetical protein
MSVSFLPLYRIEPHGTSPSRDPNAPELTMATNIVLAPPPGMDLSANHHTEIILSGVIPFALAMVAVVLLFVARYFSGAGSCSGA